MRAPFTRELAYASAMRVIGARPAPTALVASNNVLGEATFSAIRDLDLQVPGDISVVMFDDVPWASLIRPAVTVVAQPTVQMGQQAARLVANPALAKVFPMQAQTELIIRGSAMPWHPPVA